MGTQHFGQRRFGLDDEADRTGNERLPQPVNFTYVVSFCVDLFLASSPVQSFQFLDDIEFEEAHPPSVGDQQGGQRGAGLDHPRSGAGVGHLTAGPPTSNKQAPPRIPPYLRVFHVRAFFHKFVSVRLDR